MTAEIRVITLKAGMPTVQEARARLNAEIDRARSQGTVVLKLIHGYGSTGTGGKLKDAIRRSLRRRQKESKIRAWVAGEKWDIFDDTTRLILEECPQLDKDRDLKGYNEGITLVLL